MSVADEKKHSCGMLDANVAILVIARYKTMPI